MANLDTLKSLLTKVTRPLDMGGYDESLRGTLVDVWVTAPGVVEALRTGSADDYSQERKVVAILFEAPLETVQQMDDALMLWLFTEGSRMYTEYHNALKKKS